MAMLRKLAVLAAAAEAARRYAKKNPDQAAKYLDLAAGFVDKQTKGKYSGQISGVADKAKSVAGIHSTPGPAPNGHAPGSYATQPSPPAPAPSSTPQPGRP